MDHWQSGLRRCAGGLLGVFRVVVRLSPLREIPRLVPEILYPRRSGFENPLRVSE
jgi:hypothetical protein